MVKFSNEIKMAIIIKLQPPVRDLWNKFQRTGNVENVKKPGRPTKLTTRESCPTHHF